MFKSLAGTSKIDITPVNMSMGSKFNSSNKPHVTKHMSSSSSVLSVCSSTAATVGSSNTTFRGKRKKDFEDEDDDETNNCASEYEESINNDMQSVNSGTTGFKMNLAAGDIGSFMGENIEITANQNNNQQNEENGVDNQHH